MNKLSLIALCIGAVVSSQALAFEGAGAVNIKKENVADPVMSDPQAAEPAATKAEVVAAKSENNQNAIDYVSEKATQYIDAKRRKFRSQNKLVFIHSGTARVTINPTQDSWSDARIMAYKEAQTKAREKLLRQLHTSVASETLRSAFRTNKLPEFEPEELQAQSKLEAILDKIVVLADATLDNKLREQGIDPAEYNAAPPEKRKLMMKQAISNTVKTQAFGDISGSQIMKTYEKTDEDGNTAVAVIIATSNKKKNFLTSLRKSKGNVEPVPSKAKMSVEDYLAKHKSNLMYQFGTKVLWDEKGYPVLMSFGMAGNDCNPADYDECADGREFSFIDAELDAFAHISESYNLNGNFVTENTRTKERKKVAKVTMNASGDSETVEETVDQIIKETRLASSTKSSVKGLVGIQEAIRWTEKHPVTNREVNGVVLMWHPLSEQETRAFKANKDLKKAKNAAKASLKPGAGEGVEADDEDF